MVRISHDGLRLALRTPSIDDAQAIEENASDAEVLDMVPSLGSTFDRANALVMVQSAAERGLLGEFHLGIYEKGSLIGMCAVSGVNDSARKAEIGYWIGRRHWGKGLGTEALMLLVGFCLSGLNMETVHARVLSRNFRSIGLLEKLGFSRKSEGSEDVNGNRERVLLLELRAGSTGMSIVPEIDWHG